MNTLNTMQPRAYFAAASYSEKSRAGAWIDHYENGRIIGNLFINFNGKEIDINQNTAHFRILPDQYGREIFKEYFSLSDDSKYNTWLLTGKI